MAHMRLAAYQDGMNDPVALLTALAEPTRLATLRIPWDGGEHCACELTTKLGASQSRMSRRMSALKAVGLVADHRDAKWVRYRLGTDLPTHAQAILDAVMAAVPEPARRAA